MSKEKIFGVVGCGWLGLSMAQKWIKEDMSVLGTTTTKEKIKSLEAEGIIAYLLENKQDEKDLKWLKQVDVLLLNIPPSGLKEEYANLMLKIAKQIKTDAKIIFISSTSVYANNNKEVTEESELEETRKNSAYIINAEQSLLDFAKERLSIIRMSGLVGKERNPAKYMQGRNVSGGNEPVNLIHLEDCMGIIDHIINNSIWGEIFNASTQEHPSKKEYYTYAAKQLNIDPPVFNDKSQSYKTINSDKLIKKFGYTFKYADPFDFPIEIS